MFVEPFSRGQIFAKLVPNQSERPRPVEGISGRIEENKNCMAVEAGQIARGTVVHLMPYGALVRLEDGTTGLVHISEIDQSFVHNVADHINKGDTVIVKVLASGEKGKTELSIKQAKGEEAPPPAPVEESAPVDAVADGGSNGLADGGAEFQEEAPSAPPPPYARREGRGQFEDKMRDFLNNSSERLGDLRRQSDSKLGKKPR
jgi:S1 RNA binding domain protein